MPQASAWAYFWRRRDELRGRDLLILNAAALLAYLTHVVAAALLVAGPAAAGPIAELFTRLDGKLPRPGGREPALDDVTTW